MCCYPATMWNTSWCFLSYTGLREDPSGSRYFIRYLYTTLCHSSIDHPVKLHGHISFSSLLPSCFIYFVPVWSWPGRRLEDIEEQNRLSWSSWSEIASWTQHTQIWLAWKALALKSKSTMFLYCHSFCSLALKLDFQLIVGLDTTDVRVSWCT